MIFCVENMSAISILLLIIYWCWIFFMCKMFLSISTDVYVIFLYRKILMKWMHLIFLCHWHIFCVENILQFQYCFWYIYWCWLFFMCKMFLSFLTDVYVIFYVLKHIDEVDALHFHLSLDIFFVWKIFYWCSILLLIIYWCWLFFMCKIDWCLCDFLVTKTYWWSECRHNFHLLFTDVDMLHYCFW